MIIGKGCIYIYICVHLNVTSIHTNIRRISICFAGEYILNTAGSQSGSGSSAVEDDSPLLNEASLGLDSNPLVGLTDDSLGLNDTLGLGHDFTSDLLGGSLLQNASVEGLLGNDTLGLPDEFNLEEALQLVGLNEVQPEACEVPYLLLLRVDRDMRR